MDNVNQQDQFNFNDVLNQQLQQIQALQNQINMAPLNMAPNDPDESGFLDDFPENYLPNSVDPHFLSRVERFEFLWKPILQYLETNLSFLMYMETSCLSTNIF